MTNLSLSIIIAHYCTDRLNQSYDSFIRTLDSIQSQSKKYDIEIIIADDGSNYSKNIITEYSKIIKIPNDERNLFILEEDKLKSHLDNFNINNFPGTFNWNTSNSYGCDQYQLEGPNSKAFNYSRSLKWAHNGSSTTSTGYIYKDGVLILKPIVVTEDGYYRIEYSYKVEIHSTRQAWTVSNGNMISYYQINSGNWVAFNEGPYSLAYTDHFEFPITDLINLNQGDTINVLLHWDKGFYMYNAHKFLDELRIEKVSGEDLFLYHEYT